MQRVGVSVAMGNAVASIKKAADVVTDTSDRDGLSKFAHQYLLA
jgi:hydroxymethylpyrimidine pyrophosphatase-like HAD family hydrolase